MEITYEYMALALEATRGTAVTPPTHYLPLAGTITPTQEIYRPVESRGTLAEFYRSEVVRKGSEWSADGGLDPDTAPLIFNMAVGANATPTTPTGGTTTRLWTFTPAMTSDTLETATLYFGDPNVQIWQAAFAVLESMEINADASGTEGATLSVSGRARFPTQVAAPALPAQTVGELLMPGSMQVWMDTGATAIGTTELSGRVVSASFSVDNAISYKHLAAGTAGNLTFSRIGRGRRHAESTVVLDLVDTAQYDIYEAGTTVKMRVRLNGPLIEGTLYNYVQWDIYGPMDSFGWGELEGTNRTMEVTVMSEYDTTAGYDYALYVQNDNATL